VRLLVKEPPRAETPEYTTGCERLKVRKETPPESDGATAFEQN